MAAAAIILEPVPLLLPQIGENRFQEYMGNLFAKTSLDIFTHPFTLARTLIRLGHEPYPLTKGKVMVYRSGGLYDLSDPLKYREAYYFPNVFQYLKNLCREKGFFKTLYTGFDAACLSTITAGVTAFAFKLYLDRYFPNIRAAKKEEEELTDYESFCLKLLQASCGTICTFAGVIAARPFTTIMIRQIAQLVGHETGYNTVIDAFCTIWREEGFRGFFSGLVPALVAQGITIWSTFAFSFGSQRVLVRVINYFARNKENASETFKKAQKVLSFVTPVLYTKLSNPFSIIATNMALNGSGLAGSILPHSPAFNSVFDALDYLKPHGRQRGLKSFLREYKGPVRVGADLQYYASSSLFI